MLGRWGGGAKRLRQSAAFVATAAAMRPGVRGQTYTFHIGSEYGANERHLLDKEIDRLTKRLHHDRLVHN